MMSHSLIRLPLRTQALKYEGKVSTSYQMIDAVFCGFYSQNDRLQYVYLLTSPLCAYLLLALVTHHNWYLS